MSNVDHWIADMLLGGNKRPKEVSSDILAGMIYAFSTLEIQEQQVLHSLYAENMTQKEIAKQMHLPEKEIGRLEKEAFRKLRLPGRWDYICHGVRGYLRMRLSQERAKAYHTGYLDGYQRGQKEKNTIPGSLLDMPVELLGLSFHAKQCLLRKGMKSVREVASMEEEILRMRGMGPKTAAEIARALQKHGVICTLWNKFHIEEE